jgi:hypothetical protein
MSAECSVVRRACPLLPPGFAQRSGINRIEPELLDKLPDALFGFQVGTMPRRLCRRDQKSQNRERHDQFDHRLRPSASRDPHFDLPCRLLGNSHPIQLRRTLEN